MVVINSKAIFDVLKKIASRSSEIRRSDPLPFNQMTSINLKLPMSQIVLDRKASYVDLNTGKGFM